MSKNIEKTEDGFSQVEKTLTNSEQFIEKNQKLIIKIVGVVVVLLALFFVYRNYIQEPKIKEAQNQIYFAQRYFDADSFRIALNGDGNVLGFLDIADKYSSTPSGNLANLYSGICFLRLGEFQNAINSLEKFSSDDYLLSNMAKANMGDAYMELKDFKKAAAMYKAASEENANDLTTPYYLFKQGLALMQASQNAEAVADF